MSARIREASTPYQAGSHGTEPEHAHAQPSKAAQYWSENLRLLAILLTIWFVVSFGFGILLVEPLNAIMLGGYPLGFWFAQQGSIYIFVVVDLRLCDLDEPSRQKIRLRRGIRGATP
jgi:putative solute:sodium symporter small subunit